MNCECWFHRYHLVHIYKNKIYDHSQGTFDSPTFRNANPDEIIDVPSELYKHEMTASELEEAYELQKKQTLTK